MAENKMSPVQKHLIADMTRRMENLREGFQTVNEANIRTIPEPIFIRDFLPLFSGASSENKNELLSTWYLIAGTAYSPVNVVDAAGNKIIQIPAILDRNTLTPSINGTNLGAIFEEAKQRSYMSPALGDRIITNELSDRFLSGPEATPSLELGDQWEAVFTHYKTKGTNQTQSSKATDSNESDFDMD